MYFKSKRNRKRSIKNIIILSSISKHILLKTLIHVGGESVFTYMPYLTFLNFFYSDARLRYQVLAFRTVHAINNKYNNPSNTSITLKQYQIGLFHHFNSIKIQKLNNYIKLQNFTKTGRQTYVPSKIHKNSYSPPNDLKPMFKKRNRHLELSNNTKFVKNKVRLHPQK